MKVKLLLVSILISAAFLRFYKITEIPALNADEASLGYNAYSLLETGKDEHGDAWPLVFKSFGDYKPGVYVYLALPFVKLMGLNVLAVRLPGLILSVVSVWLMYLLTRELFTSFRRRPESMVRGTPNFKSNLKIKKPLPTMDPDVHRDDGKRQDEIEWLALLAALILTISPWHIHFSRGAWETQAAVTFLMLGTYAFIRGLRKPFWLIAFVMSNVLAIYTYHSMRIVVPLLIICLLFIYRKYLFGYFKSLKYWVWLAVVGIVLLFPLLWSLFLNSGLSRAQGVSIFADPGPIARIDETRGLHLNKSPQLAAKLLHNKVSAYGLRFLENYARHFSGNFLLVEGEDIQRNKVPEFGQLLLVNSPFLLLGIWALVGLLRAPNEELRYGSLVIISWLLIAPIPAALTFQSPHAVRALSMVVPLGLVTALGIVISFDWLRNLGRNARGLIICCQLFIGVLFVWDVSRYVHNYYRLMVPWFPFSSQYGFAELVPWVEARKNSYGQIFVTDRYDQPYILWLFYSQYPPQDFQRLVVLTPRDKFGFSTVKTYDNYHFEAIDWQNIAELYPNSLIIGTDEEIPEDANVVKEFKLSDGNVIFQAAVL